MKFIKKGAMLALAFVGIMIMAVGTAFSATDCTWSPGPEGQMILDADCSTDTSLGLMAGTWDLDGHSVTAMDPPGDHFRGGILEALEDGVHVMNGVVATDGLANACDGGEDRLRGIYYTGVGGSITDMEILWINQGPSGCQEGNAIEFRNMDSDEYVTATVENVYVEGYQKNGITFNGNVYAQLRESSVIGGGMLPNIAQNGVQFGYGAFGLVQECLVDGNWYTGSDWTSSGILVFETDGVTVRNNEVRENQCGIVLEAWGWFDDSADGNVVRANRVLESVWGITATAYTLGYGYSNMDSSCSDNDMNGNRVLNDEVEGQIGIYLGATYAWGGESTGFEPTSTGNNVHGNRIVGFEDGVVDEGEGNNTQGNPFL